MRDILTVSSQYIQIRNENEVSNMKLERLLSFAAKYGPGAVRWVKNNALWLVALGSPALALIIQIFG